MKRYILDTNAFLRFLLDDIPSQHKKVKRLLLKAHKSEYEIIIPEIVVFEIAFSLDKYYGYKKSQIVAILGSIISARYLKTESKNIFIEALGLYGKENIEFVDCFLLVKSIENKHKLFSFDKKLNRLYEKLN